jgi:DNA-binding LytR/AlgR family response regulator
MYPDALTMKKTTFHNIAKIRMIDFKRILYCKAESNYTRIYYQDKSILSSKVLKHFESELPSGLFIRTHRSYLVNISFVTELKNNIVVLKPDIEIPVARSKKHDLLDALSKNNLFL